MQAKASKSLGAAERKERGTCGVLPQTNLEPCASAYCLCDKLYLLWTALCLLHTLSFPAFKALTSNATASGGRVFRR